MAIERDPARVQMIREMHEEALVLQEDATDDETLEAAHIGQAKGPVAALSADTDNLFVCLSAGTSNPASPSSRGRSPRRRSAR